MAYLVYKAHRIELDGSISIGRDKNSELHIPESTVSRNHAIIKQIANRFYVIDSGSSNGTFKDGKRVHSPVLLDNKSIIQCGNAQMVFYDVVISDEDEDDATMISFSSNFVVDSIVLVADIKGYTTFSESIEIQKVSKMMSHWFRDIEKCIEDNNGYVDSFIGDCVYARWDISDDSDLVINILKTINKMNEITRNISSNITDNKYVLNICAALNSGEVIVGAETNNTGLGDTVNTAFRLESKTRELNTDVIICKDIYDMLDIDKKVFKTSIKGKINEVEICSLSYLEIESL